MKCFLVQDQPIKLRWSENSMFNFGEQVDDLHCSWYGDLRLGDDVQRNVEMLGMNPPSCKLMQAFADAMPQRNVSGRLQNSGFFTVEVTLKKTSGFPFPELEGKFKLNMGNSSLLEALRQLPSASVRVGVKFILSPSKHNFHRTRVAGTATNNNVTASAEINIAVLKSKALIESESDTILEGNSWLVGDQLQRNRSLNAKLTVELTVSEVDLLKTQINVDPMATFKNLLHGEIHCDAVMISNEGITVPCHKSVLAACCTQFKAMFESDMKESQNLSISMPAMTEKSVRALLQYIYYQCEEAPNNSCRITYELFVASDMYEVLPDLKTAMRNIFFSKSVEWYDADVLVELFQFAKNLQSEGQLKAMIVNFMKQLNSATLQQSGSYREMFIKNPQAAMELFQLCVFEGE